MTLESNNGSVIRNDKSKARQVINYTEEDELFLELVLGLDNENITYYDTDDNKDEEYEQYIEGGTLRVQQAKANMSKESCYC